MTLRLRIDTSSGVPYYKQIVDYVIYCKTNGLLKAGEQLPTIRQAAVDMKVNLNTVSKAYNELELKGVVTTQQGTGTFIADSQTADFKTAEGETSPMVLKSCQKFLYEMSAYGYSSAEAVKALEKFINKENEKKGDS